jgi:hypothetical protein
VRRAKVVGADAVNRDDGATEHVVEPAELARALDSDRIFHRFDDAKNVGERRGSRQIEPMGCSATLPRISQERNCSRMSMSSCATSEDSVCKIWRAMRCADFDPVSGK